MKEALELGKLLNETAKRDAIHIAVAPLVAGENLHPAQRIGLKAGRAVPMAGIASGSESDPVGIVDPFLQGVVPKGSRFWVFLFPQTVTGMRHHWEHPAFLASDTSDPHEWMKWFADEAGLSYGRVMEITEDFIDRDEVWTEQGGEQARNAFDKHEKEFWDNYEAITGKRIRKDAPWHSPFSCTC